MVIHRTAASLLFHKIFFRIEHRKSNRNDCRIIGHQTIHKTFCQMHQQLPALKLLLHQRHHRTAAAQLLAFILLTKPNEKRNVNETENENENEQTNSGDSNDCENPKLGSWEPLSQSFETPCSDLSSNTRQVPVSHYAPAVPRASDSK